MDHTILNDCITTFGDDFFDPLDIMEELNHVTTDSNEVLLGSPSQTNANMITPAYQCNLDTSTDATDFLNSLSLQDFAIGSPWGQSVSVSNENIDPSKNIAYVANCQELLSKNSISSFSPEINNSVLQTSIEQSVSDPTSSFFNSQSTHTGFNGLTYHHLNTMVRIYKR
jgi:hypothetical protein